MTRSPVVGTGFGASRLLLWILFGATVAGVLLRGVPSARSWASAQAAQRQRLEAEWHTVSEPAESRALRERSDAIAKVAVERVVQGLASGSTPPEAATSLLRHVEILAQDARVEVKSMDVAPDSLFENGSAKVAIVLAAESDVFGLIALLSALETDSRLIGIERLHIVQPNRAGGAQQDVRLRFDLDLRALVVPSMRVAP